jgi:hypothetical protein
MDSKNFSLEYLNQLVNDKMSEVGYIGSMLYLMGKKKFMGLEYEYFAKMVGKTLRKKFQKYTTKETVLKYLEERTTSLLLSVLVDEKAVLEFSKFMDEVAKELKIKCKEQIIYSQESCFVHLQEYSQIIRHESKWSENMSIKTLETSVKFLSQELDPIFTLKNKNENEQKMLLKITVRVDEQNKMKFVYGDPLNPIMVLTNQLVLADGVLYQFYVDSAHITFDFICANKTLVSIQPFHTTSITYMKDLKCGFEDKFINVELKN